MLFGDTTVFEIPTGTANGSQLEIITQSFLPEGWSYLISNIGWVQTPDTLTVKIVHDEFIDPADTGRVLVYAYDEYGDYAGEGEEMVIPESPCDCDNFCDLDGAGGLSPVDVAYIVKYVYKSLDARPVLPDCTKEKAIGIAAEG